MIGQKKDRGLLEGQFFRHGMAESGLAYFRTARDYTAWIPDIRLVTLTGSHPENSFLLLLTTHLTPMRGNTQEHELREPSLRGAG